jgi:predicted AlkP superfamily phosphohydrolase/phosphomutase
MLALLQFDAPALPLVQRLLAEGRLETLAALKERGTWHTMDAEATVVQSATYPTLATGVDVRAHGLYSAFPWSASDQRVRFVHAFPHPPAIWERLTAAGRASLVVDPILGWPPHRMNGVYLSGWNFVDRMLTRGVSVPADARRRLSRRHGRPPHLDDVYGRRRIASLLALRDELLAAPARTASAALHLLRERRFDLLWLNFSAAHKAGHQLWDPASVVDGPLDPGTERALRGGLEEIYVAVDRELGRVVAALPDEADIVVFAPTGMSANTSRADLLPGMLAAVLRGRPAQAKSNGSRTLAPVWSLRSRVPASWRGQAARALPDRLVADLTTRLYIRADWTRTRAMAVPGENKGYVRLNLRGRERDGIVEPAAADELLGSIAEGLSTFEDPDGSPSIVQVQRMSDLAGSSSYAERLPDLVVYWGERSPKDVPYVSSLDFGRVARSGVGSGRSGNHVDDAWAIVVPASSRPRALERSLRVTDVGATACALLGADTTGLSGEPFLEAA